MYISTNRYKYIMSDIQQYRNQISLARTEIKNLRQQITALKHEYSKEMKTIKSSLDRLRCGDCLIKPATSVIDHHQNNSVSSEPAPSCNEGVLFKPIGVIETTFQNKRAVPRQPSVLATAKGTVIIDRNVFNNPDHALMGLEEFSHIWIIFYFHATESTNVPAKVAPPRLDGERRGVLSTRSPHRPCPIGLSLVKIQSIEGNKIHFLGVDMVNGTPVLDIKPYIPQYDYPSFTDTMTSRIRPPTEGISDATEILNNIQLDDEDFDTERLSPRNTIPVGTETSIPLTRSYDDVNAISRIGRNNRLAATATSPSPDSPSSSDMLEDSDFTARSPVRRVDSERGAPDGQERFTPPQSANVMNIAHDGIRVAPWISNPPSQTYDVRFTDDALARLNELIGNRASAFKSNIETLLAEDPRSHYVRNRYPNHEYNCVLEDLSLSCIFDSNTLVCTIIAVRNAEDLQN